MIETIALFGATGATGKHILSKALESGYAVRAMVRDSAKVPKSIAQDTKVTLIQGDFSNTAAIKETVQGASYVICAAGGQVGTRNYDVTMMTKFVERLYAALKDSKTIKVFLYQGGAFTTEAGKQLDWVTWFLKHTLARMIGLLPMVEDSNNVMNFVASQNVGFEYIYTRPVMIKEKQEESVPLKGSLEPGSFGDTISFAGLASFSLAAIKDKSLYGKAPYPRPM